MKTILRMTQKYAEYVSYNWFCSCFFNNSKFKLFLQLPSLQNIAAFVALKVCRAKNWALLIVLHLYLLCKQIFKWQVLRKARCMISFNFPVNRTFSQNHKKSSKPWFTMIFNDLSNLDLDDLSQIKKSSWIMILMIC